jgi:4-amino-4-deoxy-L-arabinose transferase-like glycosyltransferase
LVSTLSALSRWRLTGWSALGLLLLLATVVRLALLLRAPAFITNDSLSYLLPGFDLATGRGFEPLFKRPPGYPLFVAGSLWLFGQQSLLGLLLAQHLVGLLTVALTYLLGRLLWGGAAAGLAGLLAALSGPLLVTEHYVMSETLFGCLLCAALLAATLGLQRKRLVWLAAAGLLLGLAALVRPVAQLLLPLLAASPLIVWRGGWSAGRAGLLLTGCYLLVVLPWMARNGAVQGSFTLAGGLGEGLAVRTIRLDQDFDFRPPPGATDPLRAERAIYREEARQGSVFELARRLREELGLSPAAADRAMREIALGAIAQRPDYYLLGSWDMFVKMFAGRPQRLRQDWQPWRGIAWEDRVSHLLPAATPEQERQFGQAQALTGLVDPARLPLLVAVLFLAGIWRALTRPAAARWLALLPPITALALLFVSAYLVGIEWRYRYPLDPLIDVTLAGGLTGLVALPRALRRWRPRSKRGGSAAAAARAPAGRGERGPAGWSGRRP